jgi:hypothetical protein
MKYDAIKEGGSMRILGHLMRVPASSYFFALLHLRKVSITNLFILLLLITSPKHIKHYFSKENFSKIKKFRTYSIITEVLATEIKKNNTITIYTYHHDSFSHNSIPPHTQDIYCLIFSA